MNYTDLLVDISIIKNKIVSRFNQIKLYLFKAIVTTPYFLFKYKIKFLNKCIVTHLELNFGDNIVHLHFLRSLALRYPDYLFFHFAKESYLSDLKDYVQDIDNIYIKKLCECPLFSINVWKNYDEFWAEHPLKYDFVLFYICLFDRLALKMGLNNQIKSKKDFIFNVNPKNTDVTRYKSYDYLIVNSPPLSSQFMYGINEMESLCMDIANKYSIITTCKVKNLPCTTDENMSMFQIAVQSLKCRYHIMIATGPSWLVLNSYNCIFSSGIFLLLQNENVLLSENMSNYETIVELRNVIKI